MKIIVLTFAVLTMVSAQEDRSAQPCWEMKDIGNPVQCAQDLSASIRNAEKEGKIKDFPGREFSQKMWKAQAKNLKRFKQRLEVLVNEDQIKANHKVIEADSPEEKRVKIRAQEIRAERELEQARKSRQALDTAEMRQARKEIKKAEENKNIWARVETKSMLSGCQPGSVFIDPVILDEGLPYNVVRITVVNTTATPITIRMSDVRRRGEVVKNLCPNGKIDIVRRIAALDPNYVNGQLTAYPTDASSGAWIDTYPYSVGWNYAESRNWVIRRY